MNNTKGYLFATLFLAGVWVLVFSGQAMAGDLEPPGSPDSTMKTLDEVEPRRPISSLPFTITQTGSYYLTGDLSSSSSGITVNADDVTIDLMGFTISGGSNNGIYMDGRKNVEIKNGTIKGFTGVGIYEKSTSGEGHRIIRVRAVENGGGVILNGVGNLIKDCTAIGNEGQGLYAYFGSTVINNTAYNNDITGIYGSKGSTLTNNTSYGNLYGIIVFQGTAKNNTAYFNQNDGMMITNGVADGNTSTDNNQSGGAYVNLRCSGCTSGTNYAP